MALIDNKILESERNAVYVKSTEGPRLTGTVEQNKDVFDRFPQLIMRKYNELIDVLIGFGLDGMAGALQERYTKTETDQIIEVATNTLVSDFSIDMDTGVITVTKKDGTNVTYDTALEKIPATFAFTEEDNGYYIVVTNMDGTTSRADVSSLMNEYTFQSGSIIQFAVAKGGKTSNVTATIKAGSIGLKELSQEVKSYLGEVETDVAAGLAVIEAAKEEVINASQTVTSNVTIVLEAKNVALENSVLSKSYAVGATGTRENEDTDNSAYYAREAARSASEARNYRNEAETIAGGDFVLKETFNSHAGDNVIHVSQADRDRWDNKMDDSDIDAGIWDAGLAAHVMDISAHENMAVDGNNQVIRHSVSLEEHEADENAHGNINIDGNL